MIQQMSIFDYMEPNVDETERNEINYVKSLARCLKVWDKTWKYGYLVKLQENNTIDGLLESFFKGTTGHYFKLNGDMYSSDGNDVYGARIDKKKKLLSFYKCGKNPDKVLSVEPIEKLVKELVQG